MYLLILLMIFGRLTVQLEYFDCLVLESIDFHNNKF